MKDHKIFLKFFIVCVSMLITVSAMAQNKRISGTIVDATGEPVIGANVQVKGTTIGTISDIDGNFTFEAPQTGTLVISYIGYQTQELALGKTIYNITLAEDSEVLEEVIVTGYATQKKTSLTSAITQVKGEDVFKNRGVSNPSVALQGEIPGLTVTRSSTRPGSEGASMKIRGDISINGNSSPLVIIDGISGSLDELNQMDGNDIESITVLKDASAAIYGARSASGVVLVTTKRGKKGKAQIVYNGSYSATIDGVQPPITTNNQFLDMFYEAQLQDARAKYPELGSDIAALENTSGFWWVFGTNSVICGQDIDTGESFENRKMWEMLRNGESRTLVNSGKVYRFEPGNYFMNDLYGSATSHKHSLSISGADDKFSYRASLGFADSDSQLKVAEDGEKKYSGRLNMDYQATDILKVETGMSYEKRNIVTPKVDVGGGFYDPWFWPYYNENGQFYDTFGNRNVIGGLVGGGQVKTNFTTFRGNAKATLDLSKYVKGLAVSATGSYKQVEKAIQDHRVKIQYYDWAGNPTNSRNAPGYLNENIEKWENITFGGFVNYANKFNGDHAVSAMLGITAEEENYKRVFAERNQGPLYENSGLLDLNVYVSSSSNKADGGQSSWAFLSWLGRLDYAYKDKYLVGLLGRRDGSSKLHPDQRWKNFYSASAGWVLSEENFLKDVSWLDFLKIRYNYGKTGSVTGIDNYERYQLIKSGTAYFGTSMTPQPSMWVDGMRSSTRTWETILSHNLGLDFTLLDHRLSGVFELYQKTNDGMFISVTYPSVLGTAAPKTNNGKFRNRGWEFSLNWRDKIGQVTYNIGGSISDANSEVMRIENSENVPQAGKNGSNYLIGKPLNSIYVYRTDGIFQTQEEANAYYDKYYWNEDRTAPKAGNILPKPQEKALNTLRPGARKVVDENGDGAITKDDVYYVGDAAPHYTFGIKAGLEWKGLDVQAFFQGVGQQKVLRTGNIFAPWVTNYVLQNSSFMGKMWSEDNRDTNYTIASRDNAFNRWNYENKDVSVQNSKYVRLKSLVVGYTLPQAWTQKVALNKVRIYFSGDDLWEWTSIKDGYDPEHGEASNSTFPFSRMLSFGLDITF